MLSVSVPQQAEKHLPFHPVPSRDGHGNYWMSEPLQVTKEVRSFEYFVSSGTTKFGATLSIHLLSMKCIVRVLTSPTSSLACNAFQVLSDYSVGLVSKMGFIDKLRLVTFKLLTTDGSSDFGAGNPPVRTQKKHEINILVRLVLMDTFNATVHFTPAHIFTLSFPSPFLFLWDAVKVSSGDPIYN